MNNNKEKDINDFNEENPTIWDWFICLFWVTVLVLFVFGGLYLVLKLIGG